MKLVHIPDSNNMVWAAAAAAAAASVAAAAACLSHGSDRYNSRLY